MTLAAPTSDEVRDIADTLGLALGSAEVDLFTGFMAGMIPAYERLDAMEAPRPEVVTGRAPGRVPRPDENPFNAWAWLGPVAGASFGPLEGRAVGVKDAIAVAGLPMRNGSALFEDLVPDFDASAVSRILAAGGVVKGKTACENLSFSGHSHTSRPAVLNPHKPSHSAGGSSSGSGAAIAAGDITMALGCDQGGSVRIPASWCGIVGLKATHGLVPYTGAFAMDAAIDYCGPMGARVEDVARLLSVIAGADGFDPRQTNRVIPTQNYLEALRAPSSALRVGVVQEGFGRPESEDVTDRAVRDALARWRAAGAVVDEIAMPAHQRCFDVWNAIVVGGTSELMFKANGLPSFGEGYTSPQLLGAMAGWRRNPAAITPTALPALLMGAFMHGHHHNRFYAKAQSLLATMRAEIDAALTDYDVLAMPTIPFRATPLPQGDAGLHEIVSLALPMVGNTAPYNASGHPAISVPCAREDGLPIGLMLVGRHFDEARLLRAAADFEALGDWREH